MNIPMLQWLGGPVYPARSSSFLFLLYHVELKSSIFYGAVHNGSHIIILYNFFTGRVFYVGVTIHDCQSMLTLHFRKDIIINVNTMDICSYFPHGFYFVDTVLECQGT